MSNAVSPNAEFPPIPIPDPTPNRPSIEGSDDSTHSQRFYNNDVPAEYPGDDDIDLAMRVLRDAAISFLRERRVNTPRDISLDDVPTSVHGVKTEPDRTVLNNEGSATPIFEKRVPLYQQPVPLWVVGVSIAGTYVLARVFM
jgi:hypothetical protein